MKGRKPTHPETRRRRGEVRRGRDMPVLILGRQAPPMPRGLLPRQQVIWRRLVADQAGAGTLDAADWPTLFLTMTDLYLAEEAIKLLKISPTGILHTNSQGVVAHPAVAIYAGAATRLRQLLGFSIHSPEGRSRLNLHGSAAGGVTIEDELGPARPPLRAVPG